jgi:serine/threonine protein kinase
MMLLWCVAQQGVDYRDVVVARQATGVHFKDEQVMAWGSQIALGLAHLHDECNLVHQDLHNGNVMITGLRKDDAGGVLDVGNAALLATTSVKILDLGLASFKSDHSRTTSERTMRMSTMRTMRTAATRRGSFVQISANEVGGFKAIRAPEMHPAVASAGVVRFNAKADVWALGILLTEAILLYPIEE